MRLFGSADLGHVVADLSTGDELRGVEGAQGGAHPGGHGAHGADRDPSGLIARALRGEDDESEDSAADDFRAMRKAVKDGPLVHDTGPCHVSQYEPCAKRSRRVGKKQTSKQASKQVSSTLDIESSHQSYMV